MVLAVTDDVDLPDHNVFRGHVEDGLRCPNPGMPDGQLQEDSVKAPFDPVRQLNWNGPRALPPTSDVSGSQDGSPRP
jgi:hypothetical protein